MQVMKGLYLVLGQWRYPLNIEWRDSAKSVKRRGKSDGASSVLLCCTHSYFCICLVVPYVSLMLYVFEDD